MFAISFVYLMHFSELPLPCYLYADLLVMCHFHIVQFDNMDHHFLFSNGIMYHNDLMHACC